MKSILLLSTSLVLVIFLSSCKKEEPSDEPVDVTYPSGTLDLGTSVSADFFGRVVDENGMALSDVNITIGTASTTTDANGVFKIDQAAVSNKLAYMKAEKSGFFIAAESIIPDQSSLNFVQITMHSKQLVTSTVSGQLINVDVTNGVSIEIPNRLIDAAGMNYHGGVNVYAKYISPEEVDIDLALGPNYGQGADGVARYFETHGMLLMEIEGYSGQKLKLFPGDKATINMRLDNSQVSNPPSGINMTYFDDAAGYWVEDGWATLDGDKFVGTISHFDHWNFALAYGAAEVHGEVMNHLGDSLKNFVLHNSSPNGNGQFYSSSNGTFRTYVPSDQAIDWSTLDECGNATVISTNGPYDSGNIHLANIQIPDGTVDLIKEFGNLLTCGATDVTNGYVIFKVGNTEYVQHVSDGTYEVDLINCENASSCEVRGFDIDANEQSIAYYKSISSYINLAGTILACSGNSEYLSYAVDGGNAQLYTMDLFCGKLDTGGGYFFEIYPADHSIELIGQAFTPGTYDYYASAQPSTIWVHPADFNISENFSIQVELLEWSGVGGTVSITFSGTYTDLMLTQHSLSGDLVVFRDI